MSKAFKYFSPIIQMIYIVSFEDYEYLTTIDKMQNYVYLQVNSYPEEEPLTQYIN